MPSVASEVQNALTARAHLPGRSSPADSQARQSSTPFAELLDSAAPDADAPPSPRPTRTDHTEQSDSTNASASADDRGAERTDSPARADSTDAASGDDSKTDSNTKKIVLAKDIAKSDQDAKAGVDKTDGAEGKSKLALKGSVALNDVLGDATPAVTAPQSAVTAPTGLQLRSADAAKAGTAGEDAGTDALLALQPVNKPGDKAQPARLASGDARDVQTQQDGDSPKAAATVDPKTVPQTEASGDGRSHPDGEAGPVPSRHTFASLLATSNADAPARSSGDAAAAVKAGADAVQSFGAVAPAGSAAATTGTAAPTNALTQVPVTAAVPLTGLAVEIATQATAGKNHFEIRLDPPDLGRIDVRLSVDHDGHVTSHLMADRADTLDLLKRDAGSLERALQQAGLKTSDNALEFSLRQQAFHHDDAPGQGTTHVVVPDDDPAPLEALRQGYGRLLGLGGGLDIRV